MSKTPRTDEEVARLEVQPGPQVSWAFKRLNEYALQLETELAEAKETIRLLTTDVNHVGGIQYWQKQHHEALVTGVLALREARANAFDEAADIAYNNGDVISARYISAKADRIRKGEEK